MTDLRKVVELHNATLEELKKNVEALKKHKALCEKTAQEFRRLADIEIEKAAQNNYYIESSEALIRKMEKQQENSKTL